MSNEIIPESFTQFYKFVKDTELRSALDNIFAESLIFLGKGEIEVEQLPTDLTRRVSENPKLVNEFREYEKGLERG